MKLISYGGLIAEVGGWIEGSIVALLPVYNNDIGLIAADTAWLLMILGTGAMFCLFPIG